jgi:hypothetical protein
MRRMTSMAMRLVFVVLIATSLSAIAAPPQKPQQIRGEGCVEPGAEARCLVVTDLKSGNLYSLFFKGMQPEIGSGIAFTGYPHRSVTTCMQGTAIDVQTWAPKDSLKCKEKIPPAKER